MKETSKAKRDREALKAIQELLSGSTWTPDTCDEIADILRRNGYAVEDVA